MSRPKGYKRTQESIDKMVETRRRRNNYNHTDETKRIIGLKAKGRKPWNKGKKSPQTSGAKNGRWIGGGYNYCHALAWEMFGKTFCEMCFMDIYDCIEKYNQRFDMHCTSNPKDFTIMEENNWMCLCKECHGKIEKEALENA